MYCSTSRDHLLRRTKKVATARTYPQALSSHPRSSSFRSHQAREYHPCFSLPLVLSIYTSIQGYVWVLGYRGSYPTMTKIIRYGVRVPHSFFQIIFLSHLVPSHFFSGSLPFRNSGPGSHRRHSPLPPTAVRAFVFMARTIQHFLPSSIFSDFWVCTLLDTPSVSFCSSDKSGSLSASTQPCHRSSSSQPFLFLQLEAITSELARPRVQS